jgi:hypothetical protein
VASLGSSCRSPNCSNFETAPSGGVEPEELCQLGNRQCKQWLREKSIAIKEEHCAKKDEEEEMVETKEDEKKKIQDVKILLSEAKRAECKASLVFEDLAHYQTPMSQHSTTKPICSSSIGIAADYTMPFPISLDGSRLKRQRQANNEVTEKQSKRMKIEQADASEGYEGTLKSRSTLLFFLQTIPEPDMNSITHSYGDRDAFKIAGAPIPLHSSAHEFTSNVSPQEVVLEPERLRRIVSRIGIDWDLVTISRCLRKDFIFRTCSPPCSIAIPLEALKISFHQMLAFADFLYATSVFEDAFPLFLLVWTTLRIESGCKEAIALVRCARAARRPEDRMIVESLLKESVWMLDNGWPQSDVIRSLLRLELSQLYQLQGLKEESSHLYDEGIEIILPQRSSLIETFNKARRALQSQPRYCDTCIRSSIPKAQRNAVAV